MGKILLSRRILFLAAMIAAIGPCIARADNFTTQQVGTVGNESAWKVSLVDGAGPWYNAYQGTTPSGLSAIGIQSDLAGDGTAIGGLDLSNWNGMWVAEFQFYIPLWAQDLHFHLNSASVDDKAGIFIDGWPVGFFGVAGGTGPGTFQFATDPANTYPVTYVSSQNFPAWPADKELMTGWNTIDVYLDNTYSFNLSAPSITNFGNGGDYTYVNLDATVTYTPDPGSWILLLTAGGFLAAGQIRRHRRGHKA